MAIRMHTDSHGWMPAVYPACRYNAFLLLYPTGVVAEMLLLYQGLPYLRSRDLYSIHMPNKWNFAWDYAIFIKASLTYGCNHSVFML
jgi:hypothetical protein